MLPISERGTAQPLAVDGERLGEETSRFAVVATVGLRECQIVELQRVLRMLNPVRARRDANRSFARVSGCVDLADVSQRVGLKAETLGDSRMAGPQ